MATGVWFGCTRGFDVFLRDGPLAFDASGHCFILVWGVLVLAEEAKAYDEDSIGMMNKLAMRLLLCLNAAIAVLWDVMFVSTSLFFHTWQERLLATAVAVAAWGVLYKCVYPALGLEVSKNRTREEADETGSDHDHGDG